MKKPQHAKQHATTHHHAGVVKPASTPHAARSGAGVMHTTGGKGTATHKHGSQSAKHQPRKARKWSPDGAVALCSVRAVAAALSLPVSDREVLDIYWSLTSDPDAGVPIGDVIDALGGTLRLPVLGVNWPQPHAVAVAPDGRWHSWGGLYTPWTDDIDEVWLPWR